MSYEAIIFDLDGTAVPSVREGMPNQELIDVIEQTKHKIHLCAATGRSWPVAKSIIKALGLTDPCIAANGAVIVDPVQEQLLWDQKILATDLAEIKKITIGYPFPIAYSENLTLIEAPQMSDAELSKPANILYILDIPSEIAEKIKNDLSHISGVTVSKAFSWNLEGGLDLHITNSSATKEHAVAELCEMLKVNRENVAGIGDGYNDIHLFQSVGYKVAMGNAVTELKETADLVIGSLEENGLANFIKSATQ